MNFEDFKIKDFVKELGSKAPVPGGGGVSALVGSLGVALGSMVGNLTLGNKKYEGVQEDIKNILDEASDLQDELLSLIQKDADVFEPLSKAYGLPKNTDLMKDKKYAERINTQVNELLTAGTKRADTVYQNVESIIRQ